MAKENRTSACSPRALLPVGITTSPRPRIEWRPKDEAKQWQVRIRPADAPAEEPWWISGELPAECLFTSPDNDLPSHVSLAAEVRAHDGNSWLPWGMASLFRVEPVPPANHGIIIYDLHYTRDLNPMQAFAHTHLVAALQGLVNRQTPELYVKFVRGIGPHARREILPQPDIDTFWMDRFRQPGGWLEECTVRSISSLEELLEHFRDVFDGIVLWDIAVPATSNIASTIAGADNLLPIPCCGDSTSLYSQVVTGGPRLPVKVDLRGMFTGKGEIPGSNRSSTGSAKCDAYIWAMENYLETGKSNPACMGFYLDAWWIKNPGPGGDWQNHTMTNHDYFIANRAFFWDLNVWPDEAPVDDPDQKPGTDAATLHEILAASGRQLSHRKMVHVGGFTPWAFKYTDHPGAGGKHEPVSTEWEYSRVLSAYNAYVDADALGLSALANASFLTHFTLPASYAPALLYTPGELWDNNLVNDNLKPTPGAYILNYTGDYDSAAWCWNTLALIWEDPQRGNVPISWAINPNLAMRVAPLFEHLMRTRTAADSFTAGDSGAGYVNVTQLIGNREMSHFPPADEIWKRHCSQWYRRIGMAFTGFLINGNCGELTREALSLYLAFSPDGVVHQYHCEGKSAQLINGKLPAFSMVADLDQVDAAAKTIIENSRKHPNESQFLAFRQVLKSPQYYADLFQKLASSGDDAPVRICDPHTFGTLGRAHLGGNNDNRATFLFTSRSGYQETDQSAALEIAVRNDGWNVWQPGDHSLNLQVLRPGSGDLLFEQAIALENAIEPGECHLFKTSVPTPDWPGDYCLVIDMALNGSRFSQQLGYPMEIPFSVNRSTATV